MQTQIFGQLSENKIRYLSGCKHMQSPTFSRLVGDYAGSEHKKKSTFAYDGDKLNLSVFRSGALECPLALRLLHSRELQGSNFSVSV